MGLLTDPRTGNGKIIKFVLQWEKWLCFFMYIGGIIWTMLLALPVFNDSTYFSENALLPGLVMKECSLEASAKQFHNELIEEMKRYPDKMPYPWLLAKFNQLYLDVYMHNFTLNYPFREQQFTGQNVYGIVRAPRGASTEAIIVSVPYRPISSVNLNTAPSIALLLAFAKCCRKQKYWAKDIIFLVTEHEQLGMQAWLEAYHGVTSGQDGILMSGDLSGRSGSIQAAINLELHGMKIASVDVKVEGLNGQLPNLDLVNLAQDMITKEGIRRTFQRRPDVNVKNKVSKWWYQFNTLISMIVTQATGVPTGNHGLFHRFGIEAITLEGFERSGRGPEVSFYQVGRVVESIVRSLNNLLERFHQSFFFYLLPSTDRYISIGGLFIKAFASWIRLQDTGIKVEENENPDTKISQLKQNKVEEFDIASIASEILWSHIIGVSIMSSPKLFTSIGSQLWDLPTEDSIYYGFIVTTVLTMFWPFYLRRPRKSDNVALVCVVASIEVATTLLCVAMHNFSLALLTAIIYVPTALAISPKREINSKFRGLLHVFWILLHPFVVASILVMGYTRLNFPGEPLMSILIKGIQATKHAFVFSVIDSMIYGNWFYNVTVAILLPNWILFWNVINSKIAFDS
ncbi:glycosylphosphatidylinositol anchor attachment 1 protein isoform X2 [Cephus cinctus]|uniref:GPI-anchor transamidase component GPAA1 n=1 Tax=Cephus cinctus TaxID=211228 RepID=A0AAJ7RM30_CEPCN|nr:glycosylphosphatidylinositol anchor attachment 1 protein isoform X2 [Cephus cinctus]